MTHYDVETGSCESENIVDPSDYDLTIYLGFQRKILSDKFLKNISKSKKLIWVEENIEQFANFIGGKDFRFEGIKYNFIEIIYRNYILSVSPEIPFYIVRPKEAEVISYLSDGHYKFPWVFKKIIYIILEDLI